MWRYWHCPLLAPLLLAGCASIPVPIPHFYEERIAPGQLHIVDADTGESIPDAHLLVVKKLEKRYEGEVNHWITSFIHFRDGDGLTYFSRRGVVVGIGDEIARSGTRTAGFLVVSSNYLPTYFHVTKGQYLGDVRVEWKISKGTAEDRARRMGSLRRQLEERRLVSPYIDAAMPLCEIRLTVREVNRLLVQLDLDSNKECGIHLGGSGI